MQKTNLVSSLGSGNGEIYTILLLYYKGNLDRNSNNKK
jgi:hypothetical protein